MVQQQNSSITDALASAISRATVEAEAKRLGVVKRQRKVDIFALVATLVFGFHAGTQRTLAALRQVFEKVSGVHLVPSAFHDRLNKNLAKLLRCLMMSAQESAGAAAGIPVGILSGFQDILAIDSSVLRLHDLLAESFPACRTNHTKAAAKLHAVMSVIEGSPRRVRLTDERTTTEPHGGESASGCKDACFSSTWATTPSTCSTASTATAAFLSPGPRRTPTC